MARLFDSWREEPRTGRESKNPDNQPLGSEQLRERARTRIRGMEISELADFVEANMGGVGHNLRDWRTGKDPAWIAQAVEAAALTLFALQELKRRVTYLRSV